MTTMLRILVIDKFKMADSLVHMRIASVILVLPIVAVVDVVGYPSERLLTRTMVDITIGYASRRFCLCIPSVLASITR